MGGDVREGERWVAGRRYWSVGSRQKRSAEDECVAGQVDARHAAVETAVVSCDVFAWGCSWEMDSELLCGRITCSDDSEAHHGALLNCPKC